MEEKGKIHDINKLKQKIIEKQKNVDEIRQKYRNYTVILFGVIIVWIIINLFMNMLVFYLIFVGFVIIVLILIIKIFPQNVAKVSDGLEDMIIEWKSMELTIINANHGDKIEMGLRKQIASGYYNCTNCNSDNVEYSSYKLLDKDLIELTLICNCGEVFTKNVLIKKNV